MKEIKNSNQIFSSALDLEEPWFLESVKLLEASDIPTKEFHIYLNFHRD